MLVKTSTNQSSSEAAIALRDAVQVNHFSGMQVHSLNENLSEKGVALAHECLIFEVCWPKQAKKVLDERMSFS